MIEKSLELFEHRGRDLDSHGFYTHVLNETRGWDADRKSINGILAQILEKHGTKKGSLERTCLFMEALMNNSSELR